MSAKLKKENKQNRLSKNKQNKKLNPRYSKLIRRKNIKDKTKECNKTRADVFNVRRKLGYQAHNANAVISIAIFIVCRNSMHATTILKRKAKTILKNKSKRLNIKNREKWKIDLVYLTLFIFLLLINFWL